MIAHNIDLYSQETFKLSDHSRLTEECLSWKEFHQKIKIAHAVGLTPSNIAEDPDIASAMISSDF